MLKKGLNLAESKDLCKNAPKKVKAEYDRMKEVTFRHENEKVILVHQNKDLAEGYFFCTSLYCTNENKHNFYFILVHWYKTNYEYWYTLVCLFCTNFLKHRILLDFYIIQIFYWYNTNWYKNNVDG